MKKELITKVDLANKEIKRVIGFLEKNESVFNYMDLKLHNASYYEYSQMEEEFPLLKEDDYEYGYFYTYCEDRYNDCIEYLKDEYSIDFEKMKRQLGRTSSFYLHDGDVIDISTHGVDYEYTIYGLMENYYSYNTCIEFLDDGLIDVKNIEELLKDEDVDFEEYIENELDYIIDELYNDLLLYSEDIIIVYEFIESFKENQVEDFKGYLRAYQEQMECELEYVLV